MKLKYYEDDFAGLLKRYRKLKFKLIFVAIPLSFLLGVASVITYVSSFVN